MLCGLLPLSEYGSTSGLRTSFPRAGADCGDRTVEQCEDVAGAEDDVCWLYDNGKECGSGDNKWCCDKDGDFPYCADSQGWCEHKSSKKAAKKAGIIIIIIIVVVVVAIVGAILACCFCCSGCPGYKSRHPPQAMGAPPAIELETLEGAEAEAASD